MSTQDKLLKSLQLLKHLTSNFENEGSISRKKDRLHHCNIITESICNSTIRIASNFGQLLSYTIEILLQLCDDSEVDVRMYADECLNKIIRAMCKDSASKVVFELHKEIKKNGSIRSLRGALWRFAELAHHIRPQKGKLYIVNLVPCIVKITERNEEQLHECLVGSLPKIMQALGCFTSDTDVKVLLKAFIGNLSSPSAVTRRSAASCILATCLNCRKPPVFINYVVNNVIDMLIPVQENQKHIIMGVMNSLKLILPHIDKKQESQSTRSNQKANMHVPLPLDRLLQIYELTVHYISNGDHNIVNAAMDTFNALLQNCPENLKVALLNPEGLGRSRIYNFNGTSKYKLRSPSVLSVATTLTSGDDTFRLEKDLTETIEADVEKWINESTLTVGNEVQPQLQSEAVLEMVSVSGFGFAGDDVVFERNVAVGGDSVCENLDKLVLSETSSEKSYGQELDLDEELEIDIGDFRDKDVALNFCIRLITKSYLLSGVIGSLLSDKISRVSVKASAVSCLSSVFEIYPEGFLLYLNKNQKGQKISDILKYENHSDPQLRGGVRLLIGRFVRAVLLKYDGNYSKWYETNNEEDDLRIDRLITSLIIGLRDDSSNCTKQTLQSISVCLSGLLESEDYRSAEALLWEMPLVTSNIYWLIKVKLAEIFSELNYATIHYNLNTDKFQSDVLNNVLMELLKDADQRVRYASAKAFVKIIPNLYFERFRPKETCVSSKATDFADYYLSHIKIDPIETNLFKKHLNDNRPFPFTYFLQEKRKNVEYSLSKVVHKLYGCLFISNNKHFLNGCIEALSLLVEAYPTTVYSDSWNCFQSITVPTKKIDQKLFSANSCHQNETTISSAASFLKMCVNFLTTSEICYDMSCHKNQLILCGNMFAGIALVNMKQVDITGQEQTKIWEMLSDKLLSDVTESLLIHIVKLLNILRHVIDEVAPVLPQNRPVLPNLPSTNTLSPIKRRKSDLDKSRLTTGILSDKEERIEKKSDVNSMGYFASSPYYMKLYEVLRTAYGNYKVTLDSDANCKFLTLLKTTLKTLSILLELGTFSEFSRVSEEVLNYTRSTFLLEPTASVECVYQLLKGLFSSNMTADMPKIKESYTESSTEESETYGLYYNVYQKPYKDLCACMNALNKVDKVECDGDNLVMGFLHRRDSKKTIICPSSSDKILANYIRTFEPMVIKALKQYTITSDVIFQCSVLKLLTLLVQLKVNYCLLDADQIFIGFVLKQFEYIEEGQISHPNEIITCIFRFLVQLSYSKQHSKCIITVPKIIQLCDGLMASEQPLKTHCIPALAPIVEDIFLVKNKTNTSDFKELETTREFLLSLLLRMMDYTEVIELVVLVLEDSKYCIDDTEKWSRWSKQVVDVVLPMLRDDKMQLSDVESVNAVKKLFFAVRPSALSPVNNFLVILFQEPPKASDDLNIVSKWFAKITILFLLVIHIKEDVLLSKIAESRGEFAPNSIFSNLQTKADPLNVTKTTDLLDSIQPARIFALYMFRLIELVTFKCVEVARNALDEFLVKMFSGFLVQCMYICQSGSHCKIAKEAIQIANESVSSNKASIDGVSKDFLKLRDVYPTVVFEWSYLLTLLNYNQKNYWANLMNVTDETQKLPTPLLPSISINSKIVQFGACITFCDYLNENISNSTQLPWMICRNINVLTDLQEEPPVSELLTSAHRYPSSSGLIIKSLSENYAENKNPVFVMRCLKAVESCHPEQIGSLLKFLLLKLLKSRHLSLSRMVSNFASRKIELLLTMTMAEVNRLLPKDDLTKITESLVKLKLAKKHEALVSLLNKLTAQFYDLNPIDFNERRTVNPEYIKSLTINKSWYIGQVKAKCCSESVGPETAEMLSKLSFDEQLDILAHEDFNKLIIKECVMWAVNTIKCDGWVEEPDLLRSSVMCLLKDVSALVNTLPKPHQVFGAVKRVQTATEVNYTQRVAELFAEDSFSDSLSEAIPPLIHYIQSVSQCPCIKIPDSNFEDLLKFAVLCMEFVSYILDVESKSVNVNFVDLALNCADVIFKESDLFNILALSTHTSWLCSAVNSVFKIADSFLFRDEPLPPAVKISDFNQENVIIDHCRLQVTVLIAWLEKIQNSQVKAPTFLVEPVKNIIVSLSRLPLVNSYALTPPTVWKHGLTSDTVLVSPFPTEYLQDKAVLEEYIFRITTLGWTNRQQFEETWMNLLTVCCVPNEDFLDINVATQSIGVTIQAITVLLMKTLYYPVPGNNNVSKLIHVSRNAPIFERNISIKKLCNIQNHLKLKLIEKLDEKEEFFELRSVFDCVDLEKRNSRYALGQVSIEYLMLTANMIHTSNGHALETRSKREKMLENANLDINSCTQFLLDLYSPWIRNQVPSSVRMIHEVIRSLLIISDLFTDKGQFVWMLDVFLDLTKTSMIENDILQQYIIVGLCKSAAIVNPELEVYEVIKKLLVNSLKSSFLPLRIASLHGLLYILEGCLLSNTVIGRISEETQLILPLAVDYVKSFVAESSQKFSQQHNLLVWSLIFFLLEKIDANSMEANFTHNILSAAINHLSLGEHSINNLILKAIERLLIVKKAILSNFEKQLLSISLECLKNNNPNVAIPGLQLLLTFMYTDCEEQLKAMEYSPEGMHSNPEHLVQTIEKVSAIFDRIKRGHVFETEVICSVLPDILDDFFSPADILTKVIGEFLSIQQPHPKFLSSVVFQVFRRAINQSQLPLLQDWVVFSLSNFSQSFSLGMATWCLSCFFISASTNEWLRSLFLHVQSRMGRYEYEDRKLLCIAGRDFYNNLSTEKQKEAFVNNFAEVRNQRDMPFSDLLTSL